MIADFSAQRKETISHKIFFSHTLLYLLQDWHWLHKQHLCLYQWLRKCRYWEYHSESHNERKLKVMQWHSQSYLGYRIPGSMSFAVTLRAPPFTAAIAHAPLPLPTSNTRRPNISSGLSSIYLQPGTGLTLSGSNYSLLKLQRQYRTNKLQNAEQWWCVHSSVTVTPAIFSTS
jgi:hypothetical protein